MPSIGIYSYELFNFFGVENIIRIGSAGSYNESVKVRDIVIAEGACTDSNYAGQFGLPGTFAPIADFGILCKSVETAEKMGIRYHVGNILSSDRFYGDNSLPAAMRPPECWAKMGVLCVEMEAAALFMNAALAGKHAAAVFTISDSLITGEAITAEERQNSFTDMMKLALETTLLL
jgi:purine-nucleoside phosphorylase